MYLFAHRRRHQKAEAFSCFFFFLFPSLFFSLGCVSLAQQAVPPSSSSLGFCLGGAIRREIFRGIGYPYPALHGWLKRSEAKRSWQQAKGFPVYLILHACPVVFIIY